MKLFTMLCAAAIAVCGSAVAQTQVDRITVHFATPVTVGATTLPAGDCSIQVLRGSSDNLVLELRSAAPAQSPILVQVSRFNDSNVSTNGHTSVILNRRNNAYQLNQIVFADQTGFQFLD